MNNTFNRGCAQWRLSSEESRNGNSVVSRLSEARENRSEKFRCLCPIFVDRNRVAINIYKSIANMERNIVQILKNRQVDRQIGKVLFTSSKRFGLTVESLNLRLSS